MTTLLLRDTFLVLGYRAHYAKYLREPSDISVTFPRARPVRVRNQSETDQTIKHFFTWRRERGRRSGQGRQRPCRDRKRRATHAQHERQRRDRGEGENYFLVSDIGVSE